MKYSQYNTIIALTESVSALYNAISDKFVIIKNAIISDVNLPVDILCKQNKILYEELIQANAIIKDHTDEYEYLKNLSKKNESNQKDFSLMINPTLDCNLKCWYCYENHIKGSKISPAVASNIKKIIAKTFLCNRDLEVFYLYFFGGEPLIGFSKTKELIRFISENCKKRKILLQLQFTSNGVLINEKIVEFLKQHGDNISFQITLDGGKTYHDKTRYLPSQTGTYEIILRNIKLLLHNKISVVLRINYTEENFTSIPSILTNIHDWKAEYKAYLKIDFQRIWQDNKQSLNIDDYMESFINEGFIVTSPIRDFDQLRFPCYADTLNQILINYNGNVYKCTARDFTENNRDGYLNENGEIVWTKLTPAERTAYKMSISVCKICSILPLCGGGCIQKTIENQENDKCMYNYNDDTKREIILNRFYNYFVKNSETSIGI